MILNNFKKIIFGVFTLRSKSFGFIHSQKSSLPTIGIILNASKNLYELNYIVSIIATLKIWYWMQDSETYCNSTFVYKFYFTLIRLQSTWIVINIRLQAINFSNINQKIVESQQYEFRIYLLRAPSIFASILFSHSSLYFSKFHKVFIFFSILDYTIQSNQIK